MLRIAILHSRQHQCVDDQLIQPSMLHLGSVLHICGHRLMCPERPTDFQRAANISQAHTLDLQIARSGCDHKLTLLPEQAVPPLLGELRHNRR